MDSVKYWVIMDNAALQEDVLSKLPETEQVYFSAQLEGARGLIENRQIQARIRLNDCGVIHK